SYADALQTAGGRVVRLPETNGHLDLDALLDWLGREGGQDGNPLQSLLVEAGPGLATALWEQDLVDRYFAFVAPKLIGQGVPVVGNLGIEKMAEALTFAEHSWETIGDDLLFRGYRHRVD
ncbi:MAG TPA: dihydrofolate reductase family protein, partial [Rhodothermales bacterium]|nr:dihydrofolate reductase family protein [Rhodothermales bacterium]